ncbi:extracellular protein, MPKTA-anchored [Anoxybacillus gonensis]|uniref:Processed acidic surface protein n=1 Tax=Anoxybacillus gonensis TaxID=198467 RepID=A0AAW7THY4_9BACL|nr:processed acidic surface protein [Anoxybacillus gonensis]AKS39561.1 extracellular protein, MPKTA-anchored [Anoxybacillus gonensis]KGP59636.1 extracellular protein, MPKTA-anchored [Anoxybacillus gonensis]MCX8047718.1 processed acidic surface protein [Anoxybacillus gonensis]MDO0878408.1 processed acidic surface protein [Anoxybacillus gonensis]
MRVLWLFLFLFATPVQAATYEEEVKQYVQDIGWTMEDLTRYLAKWNMTIYDFSSLHALKKQLGTPITPERLDALLLRHHMTKEEAEALLGQFGEQIQHYTFVEHLDYALSFYRDRYDTMQAMTDLLATIGLTEEEIRRLFERTPPSAKQALERLDEQMQTLVLRDPSMPLTKQERETVLNFWNEWLSLYQLQAKVYEVNERGQTPISFEQFQTVTAPVVMEWYDKEGNFVADVYIPRERMNESAWIDVSEQLAHIGKMALDLESGLLVARMPKTASSYGMNMIIGLGFLLASFVLWRKGL